MPRHVASGWILTLALLATPVHAAGLIDLSWDDCSGPITSAKTVDPGSTCTIYATVTGQAEAHKGYEIGLEFAIGCPSVFRDPEPPPDAWRFDAVGCQGTLSDQLLLIDHRPPFSLSKVCPPFIQTASGVTSAVATFSNQSTLQLLLFVSYPEGVATVDPSKRYHLGRFVLDQSFGVTGPSTPGTCGGLELPICIWTTQSTWIAMNGQQIPFQAGNTPLRTQDPSPVRATTWGAIRDRYR